jgi:hypothetical protein
MIVWFGVRGREREREGARRRGGGDVGGDRATAAIRRPRTALRS